MNYYCNVKAIKKFIEKINLNNLNKLDWMKISLTKRTRWNLIFQNWLFMVPINEIDSHA